MAGMRGWRAALAPRLDCEAPKSAVSPFRERDEDVTLMAVVGIPGADRGVLVVDVGGGRAGVDVPADAAATAAGVWARR